MVDTTRAAKAPLHVRLATQEDAPHVIEILNEAAAWLRQRGVEQWPERWPPDSMDERIARREVHVAHLAYETRAVATVSLDWRDTKYWPEESNHAAYLHRLAVRREAAGQHIGARLVDWAAEQAREADRAWLRLDCVTSNKGLRTYYERLGFTHVRDFLEQDGSLQSLYQRKVLRHDEPARAQVDRTYGGCCA